ncbi:MAG: nitrogenase component 1 [Anaerovoracaceae bacterium]|nr:nitrogenase component 1 [Bacillota bacterium]MDY2670210.1 nitrogenase component 1 [Anaerovoracaceae bacterium]
MLKKLSHDRNKPEKTGCGCLFDDRSADLAAAAGIGGPASVSLAEAHFPAPFKEGLEYSSPARGTWNIVHTGMLIPESHEIFVCAEGCLRGVVLTAAEMDGMGRYSAIEVRENNVLEGGMEELMIDGVADVLEKLPYRPKAILIFINCQHFFLAYDQDYVFDTLRKRFPDIDFDDCYMIPTLRKSGITPDQKMRIQMYELLKPQPFDDSLINIIGSNRKVFADSEIYDIAASAGKKIVQIHDSNTYEEYQNMARAPFNIYIEPLAKNSAERLEKRLGQKYAYLPAFFRYDRIDENYRKLAEYCGITAIDTSGLRAEADKALAEVKDLIGDTPVAIDYSFTFEIMSLVRLLLEHGINVREIFADGFAAEDEEDFRWVQKNYPDIRVSSCVRPEMRFADRQRDGRYLALGQKAAYFTGTDHFVNVVEGGGDEGLYYGYKGIVRIAELMKEAFMEPKDMKTIIQRKGRGVKSVI